MEALLPLILTFGLMYALLIRPQQRRVRQHQDLVSTLAVGDEVITSGGMVGTIVAVVDDIVTLEVAPGTFIRLLRSAVQTRIAAEAEPDDDIVDDDYDDDDVVEVDEPVEVVAEVEETTYIPPAEPPPAPPTPPAPPPSPPPTGEKA